MWRPYHAYQKTVYRPIVYDRKIIQTDDGSPSILVEQMGETYHSKHGAIVEAEHVYIQNGLACCQSKNIQVLELGLGTGLNALLTAQYTANQHINVDYTTLEAHPLTQKEWSALEYSTQNQAIFKQIHQADWERKQQLTDNFSIHKKQMYFEDMQFDCQFDVIYFDVFGYQYQPHLWSEEILQKCFDALKPNGIWVSYACKGLVNKRLKNMGMRLKKLAGPPGKREMTQAVKVL